MFLYTYFMWPLTGEGKSWPVLGALLVQGERIIKPNTEEVSK
jgi:hypothetical protein